MRNAHLFVVPLATIFLLHPRLSNGAPLEINPAELHGALQPQVTVAPGGGIHVTFGKGNTIYHAASLDAGRTFTKPVKVGELTKLSLGMRRGPRIVASDKVLAITAISHGDGNLHGWNSQDGGATLEGNSDRQRHAEVGARRPACDGERWHRQTRLSPGLISATAARNCGAPPRQMAVRRGEPMR